MAHVVLVTSEMAGRIRITAELAGKLAEADHRVTIASPVDIGPRLGIAAGSFVHVGAAPIAPASLAAAYGALEADLYVVDVELPMHAMAAAAGGRNVVLWTSMMSLWKRPGLPPLHSTVRPGDGLAGSRAGLEWAWLKFRIGKWLGYQRKRRATPHDDRVTVLRDAARQLDFALDDEASRYQWLVPYTFMTRLVLSFNASELDFPHDAAPNCRYVGPMLTTDEAAPSRQDQTSLSRLYERRERGDSEALLYASFGAWHKGDDGAFLKRVVAAVGQRRRWDLAIGLGGRIASAALGEIPPNVHTFDWAPQREVLAHADLAIHHAGISSVNECVSAGVPMVVYPFEFLDQPGNAARVAFHGLGDVGSRTADSVDRIRRRIQAVLEDEGYAERITVKRGELARYAEEDRALRTVEKLLAG